MFVFWRYHCLCYVQFFMPVLRAIFMFVDSAVCSKLLAPLVAGASRPLGLLREPYSVPYNREFTFWPDQRGKWPCNPIWYDKWLKRICLINQSVYRQRFVMTHLDTGVRSVNYWTQKCKLFLFRGQKCNLFLSGVQTAFGGIRSVNYVCQKLTNLKWLPPHSADPLP